MRVSAHKVVSVARPMRFSASGAQPIGAAGLPGQVRVKIWSG
jgi:hypothetical protein